MNILKTSEPIKSQNKNDDFGLSVSGDMGRCSDVLQNMFSVHRERLSQLTLTVRGSSKNIRMKRK